MREDPKLSRAILKVYAEEPHYPSRLGSAVLLLPELKELIPDVGKGMFAEEPRVAMHLSYLGELGLLEIGTRETILAANRTPHIRVENIVGLTAAGQEYLRNAESSVLWKGAREWVDDMRREASTGLLRKLFSAMVENKLSSVAGLVQSG